MRTTPTPDFYHYPWRPLAEVSVGPDAVIVTWPDRVELHLAPDWLQENAIGRGIDPVTRECVLDPANLLDEALAGVSIADDGALVVWWRDGATPSRFHPGWLRHIAEGGHRPDRWLPTARPWTPAILGEPPTHPYRRVVAEPERWAAFVDGLFEDGLALLTGCPLQPDLVATVAGRFGPLRDTNFGPVWDVRAELDPTTTANTERRLGPHTDLPTRETPPGFQFLHCLANDTGGGLSQMTDGLAVARHLQEEEAEHFEALTTLRWVFVDRGPELDHRWSGPIIDLGVDGAPLTLRAFYPVRAFPDMAPSDLARAYRGLRRFHTLAADPAFQMTFPLTAGDLLAFDNRRILHGRTAFEPTAGRRHLRGCYLDHDDVRSSARVWRRRLAERAIVGESTSSEPEPDTTTELI